LPSLFLIDGGKGQLDAALRARDESGQSTLRMIGLAKREEQIVIKKASPAPRVMLSEVETAHEMHEGDLSTPLCSAQDDNVGSNVVLNLEVLHKLGGYTTETDDFILVNLPHTTNLVKLLQRIRDESHRFAVSYHSTLKIKQQTASVLDDIPTIGPATRKKLLKTFGSMRGVMQARQQDIEQAIGEKKATILRQYLRPLRKE